MITVSPRVLPSPADNADAAYVVSKTLFSRSLGERRTGAPSLLRVAQPDGDDDDDACGPLNERIALDNIIPVVVRPSSQPLREQRNRNSSSLFLPLRR